MFNFDTLKNAGANAFSLEGVKELQKQQGDTNASDDEQKPEESDKGGKTDRPKDPPKAESKNEKIATATLWNAASLVQQTFSLEGVNDMKRQQEEGEQVEQEEQEGEEEEGEGEGEGEGDGLDELPQEQQQALKALREQFPDASDPMLKSMLEAKIKVDEVPAAKKRLEESTEVEVTKAKGQADEAGELQITEVEQTAEAAEEMAKGESARREREEDEAQEAEDQAREMARAMAKEKAKKEAKAAEERAESEARAMKEEAEAAQREVEEDAKRELRGKESAMSEDEESSPGDDDDSNSGDSNITAALTETPASMSSMFSKSMNVFSLEGVADMKKQHDEQQNQAKPPLEVAGKSDQDASSRVASSTIASRSCDNNDSPVSDGVTEQEGSLAEFLVEQELMEEEERKEAEAKRRAEDERRNAAERERLAEEAVLHERMQLSQGVPGSPTKSRLQEERQGRRGSKDMDALPEYSSDRYGVGMGHHHSHLRNTSPLEELDSLKDSSVVADTVGDIKAGLMKIDGQVRANLHYHYSPCPPSASVVFRQPCKGRPRYVQP
jgi:hypothetical protein